MKNENEAKYNVFVIQISVAKKYNNNAGPDMVIKFYIKVIK